MNSQDISFVTVPKSNPLHHFQNSDRTKQYSEKKRLFPPRSIRTANGSHPFEVRYQLHSNDRRLRGLMFRKYIKGSPIKWSVFGNRTRYDPTELDVSLVIVATYIYAWYDEDREDRLNLDPWIESWEG